MKILTTTPRNRRSLAGFALEEVVVALSIVGITTSAAISGYVHVGKRSDWASRSLAADTAAIRRMEQIRVARWDTLAASATDQVVEANFPPTELALDIPQKDSVPVRGTLRTTIQQISSNPPLKMVQVDCVWASLDGRSFTNKLISYRAPNQ